MISSPTFFLYINDHTELYQILRTKASLEAHHWSSLSLNSACRNLPSVDGNFPQGSGPEYKAELCSAEMSAAVRAEEDFAAMEERIMKAGRNQPISACSRGIRDPCAFTVSGFTIRNSNFAMGK